MQGYMIVHPDDQDPYTTTLKNGRGESVEAIPVFVSFPREAPDAGQLRAYKFAENFLEPTDEFSCLLVEVTPDEQFGIDVGDIKSEG